MSATQVRAETAEERVARLTVRLNDGYDRIGEKMAQMIDVPNWEKAWIELLREYESLEDELQARPAAEPVQVGLGLPVRRRVEEGVR